nr:MAG TPA: hypothetical protein [Caudoviricetes sp.]
MADIKKRQKIKLISSSACIWVAILIQLYHTGIISPLI